MSLQPFQRRVQDEATNLSEKIERLVEFLRDQPVFVESEELERLTQQLTHMYGYLKILELRIQHFTKE